MKTILRAAAFSLGLALASAAPIAFAETGDPASATMFQATTLNLSAYGETRAAPDMATITLGVTTDGATAQAAMQANAAKMTGATTALRKAGVEAKDIQTSGLNLNAQYRYEDNKPPVLTGYQASNQVTVAVMDLGRLGATVDATVGAGINQINGISFGLKDPTAAENAARLAAVKALQAKVDLYAKAVGYRAARLVSLSEGGAYAPTAPMPVMAMARMKMADSTPVSAGELKVRIDVTGLYELAK